MLAPEDQPETGLLGYFAMVPLKLRRVPRDIHPKGFHRKSYPLELILDASDEEIQQFRARKDEILLQTRKWVVQVPEQSNPEQDTGAIITIDGKDPQENTQENTTPQSTTTDTPTPTMPAADASLMREPGAATAAEMPRQTATPPTESAASPSPTTTTSQPVAQLGAQQAPPPAQPTSQAPVRTLRPDRITSAQRARILSKTRNIQIPDAAVDAIIGAFTKQQASELINRVDAGDFSLFERRETKEVPLPTAS